MADITDPQIVRWSNERARVLADRLEQAEAAINAYLADWTAQGVSALITAAGATNAIADGSETDGRQRVTGTKLVNMRAALLQLQTALDTTLVAGVGATAKSILDGVQVNGTVR
jgi:hypothetical protein